MNPVFEVLPPTQTFTDSLERNFPDKVMQEKIYRKMKEMLSIRPYRYEMFYSNVKVGGVNLAGLRHMKVGANGGHKGGAVVFYRVCEECKKNEYAKTSGVECAFCDESKGKHVVLFLVVPRASY